MAGEPEEPQPDGLPLGFEVVRKGYDQAQVDAHLRKLDAEFRIVTTDRDAAVDQAAQLTRELDDARARAERLRSQVRTLVSPPQTVQGMSERIQSMLRLAEDEVGEMLSRAETEVSKRLHDAEQRAAQIVAAARAEADEERAVARAEVKASEQACERARAELDAERWAAEETLAALARSEARERAEAWRESELKRQRVEEDFAIAMDQRRSEALASLAAERAESSRAIEKTRAAANTEAQHTIEAAEEKAQWILTKAERDVAELTELRYRLLEQLRDAHVELDRSIETLAALPERAQEGSPDAAFSSSNGDAPKKAAAPPPQTRRRAKAAANR
jgi:cell division septum initiation protein DivIVA